MATFALHEDGGTTSYALENGALLVNPREGAVQSRTYSVEVAGRGASVPAQRLDGDATIQL